MTLTHINTKNRPAMVDVSDKATSYRSAKATGYIELNEKTIQLIEGNNIKKGNVLVTAELAGIQAAKKTSELIPLCHPLILTHISVDTTVLKDKISIESNVKCTGQTGVEMEALSAVSIALLTIYDMCKAVDKAMIMSDITLIEKIKEEVF